jgi:tRNA-modifying protein YgfZ
MTFPADYRAIFEHAAIGAIAPRGQIAVAGKDRASYLQGLLTNDIPALTAGSGCYAAWLTPQGRLITDLHVLESGDMILLDVPASLVEETVQRLDQFLFGEDVQLSDLRAALTGVWIHGPVAADTLAKTLSGADALSDWAEYRNARATFGAAPVVVTRIDQLGVPGYCVYIAPAEAASLVDALERAGAVRASAEAIDAARIEAATPVFGRDMDTDTIPLEAGIEHRAISFTKGCYVGQEVIIRVLHRGHGRIAKKLMPLRFEASAAATAGAKVFAGDKEIGKVTSSADSPREGTTVALAYLHRDFLAAGTRVDVETPSGRVTAEVRTAT